MEDSEKWITINHENAASSCDLIQSGEFDRAGPEAEAQSRIPKLKRHRLARKTWLLGSANQQALTAMHQTMQGIINPVFISRQVQLHTTLNPLTPFGGLVSLIEFFNTLKRGEALGRLMPFSYSSPNAIAPKRCALSDHPHPCRGAARLQSIAARASHASSAARSGNAGSARRVGGAVFGGGSRCPTSS